MTSQDYVISTFANQRFGEVCWYNMHIILRALSLLVQQGSPTCLKLRPTSRYRFMRRATSLIHTLPKSKFAQCVFNYVIINKNLRYASMWRHWSCLCYFQNRTAGDPRGRCGLTGDLGPHVGDPCCTMCHCNEHYLSALQVRRSEQNTALNVKTEQSVTAKISGNALKHGSKTHSMLRQGSSQLQKHQAACAWMSRRTAVEKRK